MPELEGRASCSSPQHSLQQHQNTRRLFLNQPSCAPDIDPALLNTDGNFPTLPAVAGFTLSCDTLRAQERVIVSRSWTASAFVNDVNRIDALRFCLAAFSFVLVATCKKTLSPACLMLLQASLLV